MLRRTFLQTLGVAGLSSVLPKRAEARPERKVTLADMYLAGFQYHEGMRQEVAQTLSEGATVFLVREPKNRYDDQAIAVRTGDGQMIGYVPRDINPVPAVIADQGVILTAEIIRVDHNASPWERVRIRMYQVV